MADISPQYSTLYVYISLQGVFDLTRILVKTSLLKMARCENNLGHGLKPTHGFQEENIKTSTSFLVINL